MNSAIVRCPICGQEVSEDDQSLLAEELDTDDELTEEDFALIFGPILDRMFV